MIHSLPDIGSRVQRLEVAEGVSGVSGTQPLTCAGFSLPVPERWKYPGLGNSAGSQRRQSDLGRGAEGGTLSQRTIIAWTGDV